MLPWFTAGRFTPQAIVHNTPLPFAAASDVASWTAMPAETPGVVPQAIVVSGRLYMIDTADTVSVHDGVWTCVSSDGKRYKATELPLVTSVESASVATPPAITSSLFGKAWIVGPAATGGWAGMDGIVAIASGRGWVFVSPKKGMALYVADMAAFCHFTASGDWLLGLGTPSIGTVDAPALAWPFGIVVENRTTNAPPTGSTRKAYIVGPAPTGAWAGRTGQVAIGPSGGWGYLTPGEGSEVYVVAEARKLRYLSGAWSSDGDALGAIRRAADAASIAPTGTYTFSATAPTLSNTSPDLSLTHAARAAGNAVRIRYQAVPSAAGSSPPYFATLALFVDGAAVATAWMPVVVFGAAAVTVVEFVVIAADAASHTYTLRWGAGASAVATRSMILQEAQVL